MKIDWGKTSLDYARYRPGPPKSFYEKLSHLGVGLPEQRILDLGTGTGVLARQFARQGCRVTGTDVSNEQIKMAETLAEIEQVNATFRTTPSEEIDFDSPFDVITANQCFLYFRKDLVVPRIKDNLVPGGVFMTSHFSWLPLVDPVAMASEALILKHNPHWTAHSFSGAIPEIPYRLGSDFRVKHAFHYDEPIEFTREEWRGRIRASRGIGAALSPIQVDQFDEEHERLLKSTVGDRFSILHRIDAHLMTPL